MSDHAALYALFLAAGEGRRFGGPKLLRPHRGRPLVAYALDTLARARADGHLAGGVAVIPDRNTALRQLARDRGLRVVQNAEPGRGISHSLRLGLDALATLELLPEPTAALVLLADQPRVPDSVIPELAGRWRAGAGPVIAPSYRGGAPGHPLILLRNAWPLAGQITGDDDPAPALARQAWPVISVAIDGANPDIDTPDDLAALNEA